VFSIWINSIIYISNITTLFFHHIPIFSIGYTYLKQVNNYIHSLHLHINGFSHPFSNPYIMRNNRDNIVAKTIDKYTIVLVNWEINNNDPTLYHKLPITMNPKTIQNWLHVKGNTIFFILILPPLVHSLSNKYFSL